MHEPGGKARDDGEWWREIILMPIGVRLMEDYVAPARIEPYRLDYEMLVTDRPRTVVSVLQALSYSPDNTHPPSRAADRAYRTQPL